MVGEKEFTVVGELQSIYKKKREIREEKMNVISRVWWWFQIGKDEGMFVYGKRELFVDGEFSKE